MRLLRNAALLLGVSAGLGLLAPNQAQAADIPCTSNGPSAGMFTYGDWAALGASDAIVCVAGDKTYRFQGTSAFSGAYNNTDTIMIAENLLDPTLHTLNVTNALGHWGPGTLTANYNVAVTLGSEKIKSWGSGATSSSGTNNFSVTTTATDGGSCTYSAADPIPAGGCSNNPFSPFVSSTDFTNTITNAAGTLTGPSQFTNSIRQTPGPLPILGAGAAFGFSRKLRKRIKAVA